MTDAALSEDLNKLKVSTKDRTPPDVTEEFIKELREIFNPTSDPDLDDNFLHHEYYFRVKLFNKNYDKATLAQIVNYFKYSLVDAGEPVGMKAALAVGEALTQAPLKAIHLGGGSVSQDVLIRQKGIKRFQELFSGTPNKDCVITIRLKDDSKEASEKFANEQETFYFNEIWKRIEVCISPHFEEVVVNMHPRLNFETITVNTQYIKSVWDISNISGFRIHIVDVINALCSQYPEIYFITGYILNPSEFLAYIYIKPNITPQKIQKLIFDFRQDRGSSIIHGRYLKRCFVSENKNEPGHYLIQANEVKTNSLALENLIYHPEIDPTGCRITDMERSLKLFGLNETLARTHEEIIYTSTNLSETKEILYRHYKTMCDYMLSNGSFKYAIRNSLKSDPTTDVLKLIGFETAGDMIKSALHRQILQPVIDTVAASVFGELGTIGTGISKISLYKNNDNKGDDD
jgi:hypothetical protein